MSSLIKLENVSKIYRLGDTVFSALSDIDLEIQCGEMTSIVGASGSGKSTLMNIMGCLDRVTTGQYFFRGQAISDLSENELANIRNQKIGFVFQSFYLLPRATVLQNVMLPLFYREIPHLKAKEMALTMLDKVGLKPLAQQHPHQLSGGQQQRVAIARALIGEPDVILADEPTGALDSETGNEVMMLFRELNEKDGKTIIIITHDRDISRRCQRVVTIKDGRMVGNRNYR